MAAEWLSPRGVPADGANATEASGWRNNGGMWLPTTDLHSTAEAGADSHHRPQQETSRNRDRWPLPMRHSRQLIRPPMLPTKSVEECSFQGPWSWSSFAFEWPYLHSNRVPCPACGDQWLFGYANE